MSDEKENKTNELSDQDLSQITGGDKKATVKTDTPTESGCGDRLFAIERTLMAHEHTKGAAVASRPCLPGNTGAGVRDRHLGVAFRSRHGLRVESGRDIIKTPQ